MGLVASQARLLALRGQLIDRDLLDKDVKAYVELLERLGLDPGVPLLHIFVSHSSKDNDFATKLVQDLRREFGDDAVWCDVAGGLYGGDTWWSKIVQELSLCNIFIIVLSPDAMDSHWVMREFDIAQNEKKPIIPLLYRECEIRVDLKILQIISFLKPKSYEAAFAELLQILKPTQGDPPIHRRIMATFGK